MGGESEHDLLKNAKDRIEKEKQSLLRKLQELVGKTIDGFEIREGFEESGDKNEENWFHLLIKLSNGNIIKIPLPTEYSEGDLDYNKIKIGLN